MTYSAVLVAYHSSSDLIRSLAALSAQSIRPQEIIIIENSEDPDIRALKPEFFHPAKVIFPGRNIGFAAGLNSGIRLTSQPIIFSLNPDAEPAPDYAEKVLKGFTNARVGLAQGMSWRIRGGRRIIDSLGHTRRRDRVFENIGDRFPVAQAAEILARYSPFLIGVTGGCAFFRVSMLEELGYFDESFESFMEDADLGLRATAAGWKTFIDPSAECRHDRGSGYRTDPEKFARVRRKLQANRYAIMIKNDSTASLIRNLPQIILWEAIWARVMMFSPRQWIGALSDTSRQLPSLLRKRRPIDAPVNPIGFRELLDRRRRILSPNFPPVAERKSVDAIVVSYRNGKRVLPLLEKLARDPAIASITVVDSASDDGTATVAGSVAGVRVIELRENRGYAFAANIAAAHGNAPILLLANADATPEGSIAPILSEFDRADVAVAAPRLLNSDRTVQRSTHGDLTILKIWGQAHPRLRKFAQPLLERLSNARGESASFWNHDSRREIDSAAGSCLFVRRDAWREVGGMDESFFLWHEDADLCRRLRTLGYRITFNPVLEVVHELGGSRRSFPESELRRRESQKIYAKKHWGPIPRLLLKFL